MKIYQPSPQERCVVCGEQYPDRFDSLLGDPIHNECDEKSSHQDSEMKSEFLRRQCAADILAALNR